MTNESPSDDDLRVPAGAVLLHIGPHKTGTTALQAALLAARPALRAQGVRHAGGRRNPARAVQSVTGQSSVLSDRPPPIREWRALVREVRRARESRVIVSSEFLAHAGPEAIHRIVDDLGRDRVHVVVTLRPLARLVPSMWQQNVQAGQRVAYRAFLRRLFPTGGKPSTAGFWDLHAHDRLIRRWAAEIGTDRVAAVVVDDADHAAVLGVFERMLGVRSGTLRLVEGIGNRSLSAEEVEVIRAFNIAHRRAGLDKASQAVAMRYGAAQLLGILPPLEGGHRIAIPAGSLDAVALAASQIVAGIRASGVRVVGDLDALLAVPGSTAPTDGIMPEDVPAEAAARVAMGILVASGRAATSGAWVPPERLAVLTTPQLAATIVARASRASTGALGRVGRRGRVVARRSATRLTHLRSLPRTAEAHQAIERSATSTEGRPAVGRPVLPPRAILLHIGPPSTDSTAVQSAFHAARADIERQGVHYAGRHRHSIAAIRAALGSRGLRTDGVPPIGLWHALRDEIRSSPASRVVLSSELLADAPPERIRAVVDDLGADRVRVVATLLPLARIIPSQWQQRVQSGLRTAYEPWLDALLDEPRGTESPSFWHRHHDAELVARWAAVVGPERVTAIVLDEQDRALILRQFEALAGLRPGTLVLREELVNRSLTVEEIEAVRVLNVLLFDAGMDRVAHADLVNFGASELLKQAAPEADTRRLGLPAWAAPRVATLAREIVDGLRASGVRIVGSPEDLAVVLADPDPTGLVADRPTTPAPIRVPVATAGRLALACLYSSGLAHPPRGSRPARAAGHPFDFVQPIEVASMPIRAIVAELAGRGRRALGLAGGRRAR